jgi:uncharacterized protein YjbI with pentapeptide repeats
MRSKVRLQTEIIKRGILTDLVAGQGTDFSGRDFGGESVQGGNFFESIFNGCSFTGIQATQSVFQHAEFTETQFAGCTFQDSSFDHSDFVLANLQDCRFVRCSFQNAEWRDSIFSAVSFEQCIFRNTTTSLTRFIDCSFDDASAANFIGPSKRFSVFSRTQFHLPEGQMEFLRTNFGLTSSQAVRSWEPSEDPLFQVSLRYYVGTLTSRVFYRQLSAALDELTAPNENPHLLRMQYVCAICRSLIDEDFLSVFTIQFLDATVSSRASDLRDRRQMLEIMSLALGLRVALRDEIALIDQELSHVADSSGRELSLRMEFQNTYQRSDVIDYLAQMAAYCHISAANIRIEDFHQGSTFIDALVAAGTQLAEVFRFIRYSLSLATVTVSQAGKLKKECDRLSNNPKGERRRAPAQSRNAAVRASKGNHLASARRDVSKEVMGFRSEAVKSIEVFVDTANERVLVLDGRVQVTITLR